MGAQTFFTISRVLDPKEAFQEARKDALYWYGHGGYTGTIAEKDEFLVVSAPLPPDEANELAERLINEEDPRIDDKWGPAGAIPLVNEEGQPAGWLFFGWASS